MGRLKWTRNGLKDRTLTIKVNDEQVEMVKEFMFETEKRMGCSLSLSQACMMAIKTTMDLWESENNGGEGKNDPISDSPDNSPNTPENNGENSDNL